jgi:hypothetical protein
MLQASDLKLQQAWEVIEYKNGEAQEMRLDWRDVPTVSEPQ